MITFSELASGRGLLVSCEGELDLRDMYEKRRGLIDDNPSLGHWYFALVDFSAVVRLEVTAADFDRLIEQDRKIAQHTQPGLPIAVIARTELPFGISRMWGSATDSTGWEIQVFRERPAAEAWIRHRVLALFHIELPDLSLDWNQADGSPAPAA